jgi:indolepyruvate ferredoxin oxidoreductase alpha subunit
VFDLLSGNEALARGAYEAGVAVAAGYPGTPSTEILEALAGRYHDHVYCEWAPNEKVAYEVAAGAALTGARALVTMKHVGLNVAADPLMTSAYIGTVGGLAVIVADDPGMHSSQNEQDSRHYARFAKLPMFEPSDAQEACDDLKAGLEISERFTTPVLIRTSTRVSHSRSLVELGERRVPSRPVDFAKDPARFVPVPAFARKMRVNLEARLARLREAANTSALNRIEMRDPALGIVAAGIAYQYVREAFPEASVLKLGWSYPFPDDLIRRFAASVQRLLVVEELDDILEEHIRSLGIPCTGRAVVPGIGELSPSVLAAARAKLEGKPFSAVQPVAEAADLPARPPTLCAGCPHRGVFYALKQYDVVVTGDIGCYALGVLPPLARLDTILCMGAGIGMAHGMQKAGNARKVVGIVGDSTFFHSGITGILDIAYNRGQALIIVVDNRTTAMTGHQDHPGTGKTLMGQVTGEVSIEAVARACGFQRVHTIDPNDLDQCVQTIGRALEASEPALIVSRAPCILKERKPLGPPLQVNPVECVACGTCLELGCPAMEARDGAPSINARMCVGCTLCAQVCEVKGIVAAEDIHA